MSENERFTETFKVEEKTEKEGSKGTFYSLKSDKKLVVNVGADLIREDEPIKIGGTYTFEGKIYPPKPGYTHGSRWATSYHSNTMEGAPEQKPKTTQQPKQYQPVEPKQSSGDAQPPRNAYETQQNGLKFGNKLTNAVALVVAQVNAGKLGGDNKSIENELTRWFQVFNEAERTGKFEVPF